MLMYMAYDLVTRTNKALWARSSVDAHWQQLTQVPRQARPVDLSPDGTRLVISVGSGVLGLVDLPDGEVQPLKHPPGRVVTASFSPDGERLALLFVEDGIGVALSIRPVGDGDDRVIWREAAGHSNESALAWSPSAHAIAVTRYVSSEQHDFDDKASDDYEPATIVLNLDGTPRGESAFMAVLTPTNRTAWTRHGLSVMDWDTDQLVSLAGEPIPREESAWQPRCRTAAGSMIPYRGDGSSVVIDSAGVQISRIDSPDGTQLGDICISDLFEK